MELLPGSQFSAADNLMRKGWKPPAGPNVHFIRSSYKQGNSNTGMGWISHIKTPKTSTKRLQTPPQPSFAFLEILRTIHPHIQPTTSFTRAIFPPFSHFNLQRPSSASARVPQHTTPSSTTLCTPFPSPSPIQSSPISLFQYNSPEHQHSQTQHPLSHRYRTSRKDASLFFFSLPTSRDRYPNSKCWMGLGEAGE